MNTTQVSGHYITRIKFANSQASNGSLRCYYMKYFSITQPQAFKTCSVLVSKKEHKNCSTV